MKGWTKQWLRKEGTDERIVEVKVAALSSHSWLPSSWGLRHLRGGQRERDRKEF